MIDIETLWSVDDLMAAHDVLDVYEELAQQIEAARLAATQRA